jgi:hypothetical protein
VVLYRDRHVRLLTHFRRVAAALGRSACVVVVCVDARDARGCVSTLRLSCQASSCMLFCIYSLLAVVVFVVAVVVVFRALVCTCMVSLSSRCDLRERRCVAGLCGGLTASGTCGLSGCVVLGSLAHGIVRER